MQKSFSGIFYFRHLALKNKEIVITESSTTPQQKVARMFAQFRLKNFPEENNNAGNKWFTNDLVFEFSRPILATLIIFIAKKVCLRQPNDCLN